MRFYDFIDFMFDCLRSHWSHFHQALETTDGANSDLLIERNPPRDAGVIILSTCTHIRACTQVPLINWLSLCGVNLIMQGCIKKKRHPQQKNNMNIKDKIVRALSC